LFELVVLVGYRVYAAYLPAMIYYDASLLARAKRLLPGSGIPQLVTP
jgi:hypothetical protein